MQLSSTMVYGFNYPENVAEDGPKNGDGNPYCQTKIECENAVLQFNDPESFGVIIICPGDVYGPGSNPWVVRPLQLMKKKQFFLVNGGRGIMNIVYIDNLITGIFSAIEHEAYGEVFNITDGDPRTAKEYFSRLAEIGGMPRPKSLPFSIVKALVFVIYQFQKRFKNEVDMMPDAIKFINRPYPYSNKKSVTVLHYKPAVGFEEGMKRTQEWLQSR